MTPEHRRLLERAYGIARGRDRAAGPPTPDELAALADAGWPTGTTTTLSHDEVVDRLVSSASRFDEGTIASAFVAGTGSAPQGRQALVTYAYARHLTPHEGVYEGSYTACRACGIDRTVTLDRTRRVLSNHLGTVWNERPGQWWPDLEELHRSGPPMPTDGDRETFAALLTVCEGVDASCTPGRLEREVARSKVVPAARDTYARYGILQALAETGVLPNDRIAVRWDRFVTPVETWAAGAQLRGAPRSDVVLPLAAWRGALGVDRRRARAIFSVRSS